MGVGAHRAGNQAHTCNIFLQKKKHQVLRRDAIYVVDFDPVLAMHWASRMNQSQRRTEVLVG